MRNLKRVLALALAVVMMIGMMVTASAATYADKAEINEKYATAVEVTSDMGLFRGQGNGFAPKATLTRAEAAAIIYRVMTTDVKDAKIGLYDYASLKDIEAGKWYTGYVTYANNGGYVKGDGTNFYPLQTVTGTQFLAMVLRAMGYGQNGEFEGAAWKDMVLTKATDLGLVKNVTVTSLDIPATREIVAQILFDALQANTTYYTPALGYIPTGTSLGASKFDLKAIPFDLDDEVWGRPGTKYVYDTGAKKTMIVDKPVYTNTVAVDECDIAKAMGLTKSAVIDNAFIDGEEYTVTDAAVTTNRYGTINPLAYTSTVGAQGRILEVYDMGTVAGTKHVRIVEINTYLAQVASVTPTLTDKNGHVVDATATFNVYVGYDDVTTNAEVTIPLTYKTAEFAPREYALVAVSNPNGYNATAALNKAKIESVVKTTAAIAGPVKGYTIVPATTTLGATTFKDADKFFLEVDSSVVVGTTPTWKAFTDAYGNLIGMVEADTNYLVIEGIRWIDTDATLYGGYALADVVLADGTKVPGVTIAKVGANAANHSDAAQGALGTGKVSDSLAANGAYYDHIFSYTVNANGTYNISGAVAHTGDLTDATIVAGFNTIAGNTNSIVANDQTVFLVADYVNGRPTYTYTVYVGKNNVPSLQDAKICYRTNNGYATLAVVYEYALASNTFQAYVRDDNATEQATVGGSAKWVHKVYKVGSVEPTIVYSADQQLKTQEGFYTIVVDADGVVTSATPYIKSIANSAATVAGPVAGFAWDRAYAKLPLIGGSLKTTEANKTTGYADFNVDDASYIVVTTNTNTNATTLTAGKATDLVDEGKVIVAYTTVANTYKDAAIVYIFKTTTGAAVNPDADPSKAVVTYVLNVQDGVTGETTVYTVEKELTSSSSVIGTSTDYLTAWAVAEVEAEYGIAFSAYTSVGVTKYTETVELGDTVTFEFTVRV